MHRPLIITGLLLLTTACGDFPSPARPAHELTFSRDIAPIIFENCSTCHHAGGPAPFSLLRYQDVKKRSKQIAIVTRSGYMPPWLPETEEVHFQDQRGLDDVQIATIEAWVSAGCAKGDPADAPPTPKWAGGWQLGEPDLIATMPEPYNLGPSGKDVFRNFVIPVDLDRNRFVKGVEIRPGNIRAVHHLVVLIDPTRTSRRLAAKEPQPGYGGMDLTRSTARYPEGALVGWAAGKVPHLTPEHAWPMRKGSDLVLQVHMTPTGKEETIQPTVGFYFSDKPPANLPTILILESTQIDLPPGSRDVVVSDHFTLPVDIQVLGIYPHAHYLGKQMTCVARLPDGSTQPLIRIDDWDFNWQDEYHYLNPISLPQGTILEMKISYDNSTRNVRNPHNPPQHVTYGSNSDDEMANMSIRLLTQGGRERMALQSNFMRKKYADLMAFWQRALQANPEDAVACHEIGHLLAMQGKNPQAVNMYRQALKIDPDMAGAHYNLACGLDRMGQPHEALKHFYRAVAIQSDFVEAHNNIGSVLSSLKQYEQAVAAFRRALYYEPSHPTAGFNLARTLKSLGKAKKALEVFRQVVKENPTHLNSHLHLAHMLNETGNLSEAIRHYRMVLEIDPRNRTARQMLQQIQHRQP